MFFISIIIIGLCLYYIQSLKTLKQTAQEIRKVWFKKNPQVRESQGRAQLWSRWKSFTRAASPRRTSSSTGRSSTATPSRWIMSRTAFRSKEHATLIVPTNYKNKKVHIITQTYIIPTPLAVICFVLNKKDTKNLLFIVPSKSPKVCNIVSRFSFSVIGLLIGFLDKEGLV